MIIKRSGKREEFDEQKLVGSLRKAAIDAGCKPKEKDALIDLIKKQVTQFVKSRGSTDSKDIREEVLSLLDKHDPKIGEAWRNFDFRYKLKTEGATYMP